MRSLALLVLCLAGTLWSQQESQTNSYTYDVNGNRVGGPSVSSKIGKGQNSKTERVTSINGRSVPLETVEEKVIEDSSRGRIVERTIQRYDQNGNPAPPERVRIEERRGSGGQAKTTTTHYNSDINGGFQVRERVVTDSRTTGQTTKSTTLVERPTVNGSMDLVERRAATVTEQDEGSSRDETIYRRTQSGGFAAMAREVTETVVEAGRETTTKARYNTTNDSARMELAGQTVTDIETRADGSQTTVVSQYGNNVPGRSIAAGRRAPELREQLITERTVEGDGAVMETTGVRRASPSDPSKLEAYQKVSETVCRGQCLEAAPAAKTDASAGKQDSKDN